MKICSKCKTTKDNSQFRVDKSLENGLRSSCKKCDKEFRKQNKDKIKQQKIIYYQKIRKLSLKEQIVALQQKVEELINLLKQHGILVHS